MDTSNMINNEKYYEDFKEDFEKKYIFENLYVTEKWVMTEEEAGTPIWFHNERLKRIDGNIERNTA